MKETSLPKNVKNRLKIAKLFYPLDRTEERKFARIFNQGINELEKELELLASKLNFLQERFETKYILWKDPDSNIVESMFCIIKDPSKFSNIKHIINMIENINPTFTYAIVHQWKEGEGTYDIFRLSKFSDFEHCNRVKLPKSYKKLNSA